MPLYLLGKNLAGRGWYGQAAGYLDRALAVSMPPTACIGRETLRQRAISACALGDAASIARTQRAVSDPDGPFAASAGRRDWVLRLLSRCGKSS